MAEALRYALVSTAGPHRVLRTAADRTDAEAIAGELRRHGHKVVVRRLPDFGRPRTVS